jgi:probable phosphoglycerate mutase
MELNAGVFQGKLWSEIQVEHPEAAERWLNHDPDFIIPGGESRRQLMARGLAALEAIRQRDHRHAAIVAHGGVLSAAFKALLGVPAECNPFELYNGSISQIRWDAKIKLMTLNQIDHLAKRDGEFATRSGDL